MDGPEPEKGILRRDNVDDAVFSAVQFRPFHLRLFNGRCKQLFEEGGGDAGVAEGNSCIDVKSSGIQ